MAPSINRQQLAARVRRQAHRLGWIGAGGVLLALLATLELLNVTLPALDQSAEIAARIERLDESPRRGAPIEGRRGSDATSQLEAFEGHFPERSELNATVAKVHALASAANVELLRGEYQTETEKSLGLTRFQMNLPVNGSYAATKTFLRGVLNEIPSAALDGINLQRKGPAEDTLETVIRISLYTREDAPAAEAARDSGKQKTTAPRDTQAPPASRSGKAK